MAYRFFIVSANRIEEEEKELNKFLQSNVIISITKEFSQLNSTPMWMFCIEYVAQNTERTASLVNKDRTDYKTILGEKIYTKFLKLKEIRKKIATDDAVPAYAVFTNDELIEMSKIDTITLEKLRENQQLNKKRIEKYGIHFISE